MAKAKKILLHERRETWRVRVGKARRVFCERCGEETTWLTGAEAALAERVSEREIFRLAEGEQLHSAESDLRQLLVCERSLHAVFRDR